MTKCSSHTLRGLTWLPGLLPLPTLGRLLPEFFAAPLPALFLVLPWPWAWLSATGSQHWHAPPHGIIIALLPQTPGANPTKSWDPRLDPRPYLTRASF